MRSSCAVPALGRSQCVPPPNATRPTRSRSFRCAAASVSAARTARTSVPSCRRRASANVSRNSTTSALRSGWWSLTIGAPRRAVARQFTRRTRSPGANGRRSANSIPSPRCGATRLPAAACARDGPTRRRSRSRDGRTRTSSSPACTPSRTTTPSGPRARAITSPTRYAPHPRAVTQIATRRSAPPSGATVSGSGGSVASRPCGSVGRSSSHATGASAWTRTSSTTVSPSRTRALAIVAPTRRPGSRAPATPTAAASANGTTSAAIAGRPRTRAASAPAAVSSAKLVSLGDAAARIGPPQALRRLRRRHRLEALADDRVAADPAHPQLRVEHEPVRERGDGERLDVVGDDVVAARQRGAGARELHQRERPARARADLHAHARARLPGDRDDVAPDGGGDMDLLHPALERQQLVAVDDRAQLDVLGAALDAPLEHLPLVVGRRVADRDAREEPVELRLGQRVRALVLDRVLRRDDEERALERAGRVVARDLALLHRLEQRGLRLRRRAVDLVAEQDVREDRPGPERE